MVDARALRIVYFGTPEFAVPSLTALLDSRHRVVAVVSQPDRPKGRGQRIHPTPTKTVAVDRGVDVLQPERLKDPELVSRLAAMNPDLGVVAAYGRLIPDGLLAVPSSGMINVHGSILPAYRGAAPVHRAVIAGDTETGVTIMRVIRELDAGATFAMRATPIGPDETSADVERRVATLGAELLLDVVEQIAAGTASETPQDDSRATYAPKLTKDEGRIDWNLPAATVHNLVRGLQPWPQVTARLGTLRLLITRTERIADASAIASTAAEDAGPGSILHAGPDGLVVLCGNRTALRVLDLQPEGKRMMSARDFLAGHRIQPGSRLESP